MECHKGFERCSGGFCFKHEKTLHGLFPCRLRRWWWKNYQERQEKVQVSGVV